MINIEKWLNLGIYLTRVQFFVNIEMLPDKRQLSFILW